MIFARADYKKKDGIDITRTKNIVKGAGYERIKFI